MGFLSKAIVASTLNPAERTVRDRILRLIQRKEGTSPYTALSLLKAHAAFQIGVCLSLRNDRYVSYASVGLGITRTIISPELITACTIPNTIPPYCKIDRPEEFPVNIAEDADIWLFPLEDTAPEAPCHVFLLIVENGSSAFNPTGFACIVATVRKALLPSSREEAATTPPEPFAQNTDSSLVPTREGVENSVGDYCKQHPAFQGIVLELPTDEDGRSLALRQLDQMVSSLGVVIRLNKTRDLALFPQEMDRELIVHRLVKSLGVLCPRSFEADSPERAFAILESFW
jgi:hypothetical protein